MTTRSGVSITYKTAKQRTDEGKLSAYFVNAAQGRRLEGPLRLQLVAYMPIPASWSKAKKEEARQGRIWPERKPDADNIIKHVLDSAQGIVFEDDKSICQILASKAYGEKCGYEICFERIG